MISEIETKQLEAFANLEAHLEALGVPEPSDLADVIASFVEKTIMLYSTLDED